MQVTINVATVFIRGAERPVTAKLVNQLPWVVFGGLKTQYSVVGTCKAGADWMVLVQGPMGLGKVTRSTFINCGLDKGLGVDMSVVPHIILD